MMEGNKDELKSFRDYIQETSERLSLKSKLLEENMSAVNNWPDESFFVKKDSALKKNTAFVKKVRNFLDSQKEALLSEFESLNLSKYVEEVATAIVEAKLKTTDIPFILKLCSAMHQRYSNFGSLFLDAWRKVFVSYKDSKQLNLSKLRVDLLLFADLNTIGIFREAEGIRLLASQLTSLTNGDMEHFSNVGTVCSFCRHCCDDWLGCIPRKIRVQAETCEMPIPRSTFMPAERQAKCRTLFNDYLVGAKRHLQQMIKEAVKVVSCNRELMENRGEISEDRLERADQLVGSCRKFHESLCTLSDLLDSDPPADFNTMLKTDSKTNNLDPNESEEKDALAGLQLFEDDDTRLFYESLPDIKAMVPGILYKDSEHAKPAVTEEAEVSGSEDVDVETVEYELAKEEARCKAAENDPNTAEIKETSSMERSKSTSASIDDGEEEAGSGGRILMETFLTQLPNCINRDLIDRAAIDFCLNLNKRSNRRRLARALLMVPRTRYDLLPFYARLVAALAPVMPDLVSDVNTQLLGEFRWRVSKRDQMNLESKLKVVRFMGELVKFRIFPAHQALSCLKQLLPQFVHHNIDMACALLDTCGRFLYRLPSSHQRTKVYLEVMLRKKTALHMDQRYCVMIENSYYYCNPPPSKQLLIDVVQLSPMMQYLRHLLWCELDRNTVNSVLRSFRRMDWNDLELVKFVEQLFTRAWEVPFTKINCVASVLSGLAPFHPDFATAVVDNVIEDIRVGMELNFPQLNQRRISTAKYLGLLYVYCLVDSPVIFKMLYSLLTFGVSLDNNTISFVDPPDSLFRIVVICTLLETLGGFFDQGKKRRKLNIFLIYFQRYYWFKRSQPFWIQPSSSTGKVSSQEPNGVNVVSDCFNSVDSEKPVASNATAPADACNTSENCTPDNQAQTFFFTPIAFPAAVEQQYVETLSHLRFSVARAKSFPEAQRLVSRLEARYLPRLLRAKATFGLMENDGDASDSQDMSRTPKPDGPGHMAPITEELEPGEEIPLDEEDYVIDDDDEDDDDFEYVQKNGIRDEEDGNYGRRRNFHERSVEENAPCALADTTHPGPTEVTTMGDTEMISKSDGSDDERVVQPDSEEERLISLGLKPRFIDCPEDEEFREALDRMTAEAFMSSSSTTMTGGSSGATVAAGPMDSGPGVIRTPAAPVLPSPDTLQLIATRVRSSKPSGGTLGKGSDESSSPSHSFPLLSALQSKSDEENLQPSMSTETGDQSHTVVFNLITRRGTRPHLVPLAVPETVQFAARYVQAEAAEREEKARMKQLVLEMHEAQKEEEMEWGHLGSQDAVLAHQFPLNANRDRWAKYNHPKGAPDADALFGGSSQRR